MLIRDLKTEACRLYPYKVALACLCFLLLVPSQPIFADQKQDEKIETRNRKELIYSWGEILISDIPLPDPVFAARRKVIQIFVEIHKKNASGEMVASAMGSGYTHKPGLVISSAHIVQEPIYGFLNYLKDGTSEAYSPSLSDSGTLGKNGEIRILTRDAINAGQMTFDDLHQQLLNAGYDFVVYGIVYGRYSAYRAPLKIKAITNFRASRDLVALGVEDYVNIAKQSTQDDPLEQVHPLRVFVDALPVTEDVELGQTVYTAGFGRFLPYVEISSVIRADGPALREPFIGLSQAIIVNVAPNFGFSGGPTFDIAGRVIGISKEKTDHEALIVSTKDIKSFLKAAKLDK